MWFFFLLFRKCVFIFPIPPTIHKTFFSFIKLACIEQWNLKRHHSWIHMRTHVFNRYIKCTNEWWEKNRINWVKFKSGAYMCNTFGEKKQSYEKTQGIGNGTLFDWVAFFIHFYILLSSKTISHVFEFIFPVFSKLWHLQPLAQVLYDVTLYSIYGHTLLLLYQEYFILE